jgi:hypothetical protein
MDAKCWQYLIRSFVSGDLKKKENKLEAQRAEPVSLTFHSASRKRNTEPSTGASQQMSDYFGKAVSEKICLRN